MYIQFNQKSSQTEGNGGKSKDLVRSHSLPEPEDPETEEGQQVQGKETSDHLVDKHVALIIRGHLDPGYKRKFRLDMRRLKELLKEDGDIFGGRIGLPGEIRHRQIVVRPEIKGASEAGTVEQHLQQSDRYKRKDHCPCIEQALPAGTEKLPFPDLLQKDRKSENHGQDHGRAASEGQRDKKGSHRHLLPVRLPLGVKTAQPQGHSGQVNTRP